MDALDDLVVNAVMERVLSVERVGSLLVRLLERQEERREDFSRRSEGLQRRGDDAEARLRRLYEAIESGVADLSDPTLQNSIAKARAERDSVQAALARAMAERAVGTRREEKEPVEPHEESNEAMSAAQRQRLAGMCKNSP